MGHETRVKLADNWLVCYARIKVRARSNLIFRSDFDGSRNSVLGIMGGWTTVSYGVGNCI